MKKSIILFLSLIIFLSGCDYTNLTEESKNEYLNFKEELEKTTNYDTKENIPFDIKFSLDRINEEEISYRVILDNPHEKITNIKALLIHDHLTEDVFPSIGIFDSTPNLIPNDEKVKGIVLAGYLNTLKEIEDIDIELKLLVEYTNCQKETKKIYYKMTK